MTDAPQRTQPAPAEPVAGARFREVMAAVCTPVSVVTTTDGADPFGTTVSAFASLSLDPPMVLVSLDRGSDLLAAIGRSRRFGVNVLGRDQAGVARAFARKGGPAKFAGIAWDEQGGVPRLPRAGFLACELAQVVDGGDHRVLMGLVVDAEPAPGPPLTYHSRTFGTHAPLDGDS